MGFQPKQYSKGLFVLLVGKVVLLCTLSVAAANTRLAIGSFGLASEKADGELADLIAVKLSATPELELVERRELDKTLNEATLTLAGLTKPKDAVRVGTLVRVDQFVLGTTHSINGTTYHVVRLVDARSGAIRAISVFHDDALNTLAESISRFVIAELKRPPQEKRDYLAIGVIQNLGVNNRFSDFPAQMRGSLAANLSGKVTVLERDVISFLANEVTMNLAGMTKSAGLTNSQVQLAFWIVDGFYQSYEVAKPEVQLKLRVQRLQGGSQNFMLQGEPNEQFFAKIAQTVETAVKQPPSDGMNKQSEIAALEERGRRLIDYRILPSGLTHQVSLRSSWNPAKATNTLAEAIRVYESILLLDPDNVAAKMRLAGCLLYNLGSGNPDMVWPADLVARVTNLYKEVGSSGSPEYSAHAKGCLASLKGGVAGLKLLRQFIDETDDQATKKTLHSYGNSLALEKVNLPFEEVLPVIRDSLLDDLAEVEKQRNQPFQVNFQYAFFAINGPKTLNAILPELLEHFPNLKPHILLAAVAEQTETNSPVIPQFLKSLKEAEEHPETLLQPASYFTHLSTTLEDEDPLNSCRLYHSLYEETFQRGHYSTVIAMALARQRACAKGLAPPLTEYGKELLARSYGFIGQWKNALDVYNTLKNPPKQAQIECRKHLGLPLVSRGNPELEWSNATDVDKVRLAYSYMDHRDWLTAAAILDSIGHRTVVMNEQGPWEPWAQNWPVLPVLVANQCRVHAGKPPIKDPIMFELGSPYIRFSREATRFNFQTEDEDVWVGIYSRIERFSGPGPIDSVNAIEKHDFPRIFKSVSTGICVSPQFIWLGTDGDGLFELDRNTGVVHQFTMKDGLLLDGISGLCLQSNTLWIAYRKDDSGGVGTLDIQTHKFSARTPKLSSNAGTHSESTYNQRLMERNDRAPQMPVHGMAAGAPGEMWFGVSQKGIQCYHDSDDRWTTFSDFPVSAFGSPFDCSSIAADRTHDQILIASHEAVGPKNEKSILGGLYIYNYRSNKLDSLQLSQGLPANETTSVAVDGNIAWVGGRGFVAVVDILKRKVLRIAYVSANNIKKIELGKRYAWLEVYTNPPGTWSIAYTNPIDAMSDVHELDDGGEATTGIYRLERATVEQ